MKPAFIQIRLATPEDLQDIQSCAQTAYSMYIQRIGQEPAPMLANFSKQIKTGQIYVAFSEQVFSGYVVFYSVEDYLHLESVAVLPSHSGKGIGKQLIKYVEKTAYNKGLKSVELYTNEAMVENLSMYAKLGYLEIKRKKQNGFSRVFFRKQICDKNSIPT